MKTEILEMAIETLRNQVEGLKAELDKIRGELRSVQSTKGTTNESAHPEEIDELLTTKYVMKKLGMCYNTLQNTVVKKGLLVPKKISPRKIRFLKSDLVEYMKKLPYQL